MKINFKHIFSASFLLMTVGLVSCVGDLNVTPKDPNLKQKKRLVLMQLSISVMLT